MAQFCRAAQLRFDNDGGFRTRARLAAKQLQSGDPDSLAAWARICDTSRRSFAEIYDRLGVKLQVRTTAPSIYTWLAGP